MPPSLVSVLSGRSRRQSSLGALPRLRSEQCASGRRTAVRNANVAPELRVGVCTSRAARLPRVHRCVAQPGPHNTLLSSAGTSRLEEMGSTTPPPGWSVGDERRGHGG
jgi:hypothetical protein